MNRIEISKLIYKRLSEEQESLFSDFNLPNRINSCFIDKLLPEEIANEIYKSFPSSQEMDLKKSIREYKYVSAQMDKHSDILTEIIYAFQEQIVIEAISEITGLKQMEADSELYAGGLSIMKKNNFLNPHLDNSHDRKRNKFRVLNLLYYVTPNWEKNDGGNLELFDNGHKKNPRVIISKFNRLVLMITNKSSVHGVNKVQKNIARCCVSNYYFSEIPAENNNYFHVTTFYGRPEEKVKGAILNIDGKLRNSIRKVFPKGIAKYKHFFNKDGKH